MRSSIAKVLLALVLLTGTASLLSACHTVNGVGEDISGASRDVQRHL